LLLTAAGLFTHKPPVKGIVNDAANGVIALAASYLMLPLVIVKNPVDCVEKFVEVISSALLLDAPILSVIK